MSLSISIECSLIAWTVKTPESFHESLLSDSASNSQYLWVSTNRKNLFCWLTSKDKTHITVYGLINIHSYKTNEVVLHLCIKQPAHAMIMVHQCGPCLSYNPNQPNPKQETWDTAPRSTTVRPRHVWEIQLQGYPTLLGRPNKPQRHIFSTQFR